MTTEQYYLSVGYLVVGFDSPKSIGTTFPWLNLNLGGTWTIWEGSNASEAAMQAEALNIPQTGGIKSAYGYAYYYRAVRLEEAVEEERVLVGVSTQKDGYAY